MMNSNDFRQFSLADLRDYLINVRKYTPAFIGDFKKDDLVKMITRLPSATNSNSLVGVGVTSQEVLDALKMRRAKIKEEVKEMEVEKDKLHSIQKRVRDAELAFKKAEKAGYPPDDSLDNSLLDVLLNQWFQLEKEEKEQRKRLATMVRNRS